MVKAGRQQNIVVIASEPLTFEQGASTSLLKSADWLEIPSNTIVCITPNINVLSYPIVDEYHNAAPEKQSRNPDYAMRAGFHPPVPLDTSSSAVACLT